MKIELTAEQAQVLIDSQNLKIAELMKRLRRAHVRTKYLQRTKAYLSPRQITEVIMWLERTIDSDQPDAPDDWGFEPRFNHGVLEEQIERYRQMFTHVEFHDGHGLKMSVMSFDYQFATNGFDYHAATNLEHHLEKLQEELWHEGEPATPDHFSSDDVKNGL